MSILTEVKALFPDFDVRVVHRCQYYMNRPQLFTMVRALWTDESGRPCGLDVLLDNPEAPTVDVEDAVETLAARAIRNRRLRDQQRQRSR